MNKPATLDECMVHLRNIIPPQDQMELLGMSKNELITLHHSLGLWIRNNWDLWAGGPLKEEMKALGFEHPDDMSQAIIVEYWAKLNKQPSNLDQDIEEAKAFWNARSNEA